MLAATDAQWRAWPEPFQDIYHMVSNDLLARRDALSAARLRTIREVSTLVYARDLAPQSFGRYLLRGRDGRLAVVALPAASEPMLRRVSDMRRRHHLFIDRVDEYYEALHADMQQPYMQWRITSRQQQRRYRDDQSRSLAALNSRVEDSSLALIQRYNQFRWEKIHDQEFLDLASGFSSEVTPAVLELERQVRELSGTVEQQYRQWRQILRQLFELESGGE